MDSTTNWYISLSGRWGMPVQHKVLPAIHVENRGFLVSKFGSGVSSLTHSTMHGVPERKSERKQGNGKRTHYQVLFCVYKFILFGMLKTAVTQIKHTLSHSFITYTASSPGESTIFPPFLVISLLANLESSRSKLGER